MIFKKILLLLVFILFNVNDCAVLRFIKKTNLRMDILEHLSAKEHAFRYKKTFNKMIKKTFNEIVKLKSK